MFSRQNTLATYFNNQEKDMGYNEHTLRFIRTLRTLVPFELLDANLQKAIYQEDIQLMVNRMNVFLDQNRNTGGVEQLRAYFNGLLSTSVISETHNALINPVAEPIETHVVSTPIVAQSIQRDDNNLREPLTTTSTSSPSSSFLWASNCCELSCCCVYICITCLGNSAAQHHQNAGATAAVSGQAYQGGTWGFFDGNASGYASAWCNNQEYGCCKDLCGNDVANLCCPGHANDLATASAMSGGPAPSGCLSYLNGSWCQYQEVRCNEEFFGCWTHCFAQIPDCINQVIHFAGSLGNICLEIPEMFLHILNVILHGLGDILHLSGQILSVCGNCNCSGLGNDAGQFIATVVGGISAAFYFVYDAIDNAVNHRRLVEAGVDQTSSRFIPSMIAMSISLLIFFPRIIASLGLILHNLHNGIATYQSLRLIGAELLLGLPIALCAGFLGGASGWTYTTLVCVGMYLAYAGEHRYDLYMNGELSEACYLSAKEWKAMPANLDPNAFATRQMQINTRLQTEVKRLRDDSRIGYVVDKIWPQVPQLITRLNLYTEINASRDPHQVTKLNVGNTA